MLKNQRVNPFLSEYYLQQIMHNHSEIRLRKRQGTPALLTEGGVAPYFCRIAPYRLTVVL